MRYSELTEAKGASDEEIEMSQLIKRDCQPYLAQNPRALSRLAMYRGIRVPEPWDRNDPTTLRKDIRVDDRMVSDSKPLVHDFMNKMFTELYGEPFRNAMFVNGRSGMVTQYGRVYVVFPIGEFKFLWSDKYEDLFVATARQVMKYVKPAALNSEVRDALIPGEGLHTSLIEIAKTYRTDNLQHAILSDKEIMIRGSSYYGIAANSVYGDPNTAARQQLEDIIYS